jgi:hypothetical protein
MALGSSVSSSLQRGTFLATALAAAAGCGTPPPSSRFPDAHAAVARVHATQDCGIGIHASAKIDHFGRGGRVRGDLLAFAIWPDRLRMDVVSPFGVTLATLTSDGNRFSLYDLREKRFFVGPASACNIARLTTVPMPGHVLVSLLRGEAPVLKHGPNDTSIAWDPGGYYVVTVNGTNAAEERIKLVPHPDDYKKPWEQQRVRILDVEVRQQGIVLYHAKLEDHKPAPSDKPRVDPDGIDPPIPTSGPTCNAELPRRIHVEVPGKDEDVLFRYDTVTWNPPLAEGTFTQPIPGGVDVQRVMCEDAAGGAPEPGPASGVRR